MAGDVVRPNGLAFSPDERRLDIVDSGISHGGPAHIRVFDVDGAHLSGGRKRHRLFMAASTSVYSLHVNAIGALRP